MLKKKYSVKALYQNFSERKAKQARMYVLHRFQEHGSAVTEAVCRGACRVLVEMSIRWSCWCHRCVFVLRCRTLYTVSMYNLLLVKLCLKKMFRILPCCLYFWIFPWLWSREVLSITFSIIRIFSSFLLVTDVWITKYLES